jgi:hypothetical protein
LIKRPWIEGKMYATSVFYSQIYPSLPLAGNFLIWQASTPCRPQAGHHQAGQRLRPGRPACWEHCTGKVFKIGAVDYFSGEVLCDVKVKQRCQGTNLGQTTPGMWTVSPSPNRSIDFKSYNKVFRQNAGTSLILDIHQIAVLLRSSITPETIVLV